MLKALLSIFKPDPRVKQLFAEAGTPSRRDALAYYLGRVEHDDTDQEAKDAIAILEIPG